MYSKFIILELECRLSQFHRCPDSASEYYQRFLVHDLVGKVTHCGLSAYHKRGNIKTNI